VITTDDGVSVLDQPFLIGQTGLGPFDLFGGGEILRFDPIGARIRALEQQNKAKILSEPNLLVLDGREANMLVGGEIPVPVVQSAQVGGTGSVTIEYKEFGVRLRVLPSITGENRLQLKVTPEVSSLDFSNAIVMSGFRIPALRTRRAETTVNVKDGQSLIIGGLIQSETAKLVKKIPLLGDLPIIGELFKDRSFVNNETELVIIITPQIVNPVAQAPAQ
jgi:pilus assembly protein CpaC